MRRRMIRHRFEAVGSVRLIAIAMAHSGRCQCPHQLRPRPVSVPLSCGFGTISGSLTILPLQAALETGAPVLPIYIHDEQSPGLRPLGGASRWWLHHSLAALERSLSALGNRLVLLRGPAPTVLSGLVEEIDAAGVFWNRRYTAAEIAVDADVKTRLRAQGLQVESFNASLLFEPWEVKSRVGEPMKVFTPFWRAALALREPASPLPAPKVIPAAGLVGAFRTETSLKALNLLPTKPDWAGGLRAAWTPGEAGARARLDTFLSSEMSGYANHRDRPDRPATSRLSPHLRFGEISPRQAWHAAEHAVLSGEGGASAADLTKFRAEIGWREFSYHLLFSNPDLATRNFQPKFDASPGGRTRRAAGLAARAHRLSARRRRHAPALGDGLDAQPRAHDHGVVPDQAPADRLAGRRGMVLGHAGRCRSRPATRRAGNGWPGRARMRLRTTASSIRSCRARNSTPQAIMSAASCRNSPELPPDIIHEPWSAPAEGLPDRRQARRNLPSPDRRS